MSKAKKKVFAVFGLGAFGQTIAEVLSQKGGEVIVVDNDPALVEAFKNKATTALRINATDEKALLRAPLDDVDTAIVTVGDNLEVSIITTALLKQMGIPYIVSRATSDIHGQILKQVGVNEVINLQKYGGRLLAQRLIAPEVLDTIPLATDYSFAQVYVPQPFVGKTCGEMNLLKKFGLHLSAIKRIDTVLDNVGNPIQKEIVLFPDDAEELQNSDILMLVGRNVDIEEFKKIL